MLLWIFFLTIQIIFPLELLENPNRFTSEIHQKVPTAHYLFNTV